MNSGGEGDKEEKMDKKKWIKPQIQNPKLKIVEINPKRKEKRKKEKKKKRTRKRERKRKMKKKREKARKRSSIYIS